MNTVECQNHPSKTLAKHAGTDNGCIVNLRNPSSRKVRVGSLRGGTWAERLAYRTVKRESGCWEATGHALPNGYVQICIGRTAMLAHRIAWTSHRGAIPAGMVVCHGCDNPRCVNPSHLFVGTQGDNMRDAVRKGRKRAWGRQRLNGSDVLAIAARLDAGESYYAIAKQLGLSKGCVHSIATGNSWGHLTGIQRRFKLPRRGVQLSSHVGNAANQLNQFTHAEESTDASVPTHLN